MRISDWSSDVCSSDLIGRRIDIAHRDMVEQFGAVDETVDERDMVIEAKLAYPRRQRVAITLALTGQQGGVGGAHHHIEDIRRAPDNLGHGLDHRLDTFVRRSEEHTFELQSLMRNSYAV